MTIADLNSDGRWWFLTPDGFEKFKNSYTAQGYELLSRHPRFLPLVAIVRDGGTAWNWDHSQVAPRMMWNKMPPEAQIVFKRRYQYSLRRLGLAQIAWISPCKDKHDGKYELGAITIHCPEGWPSIETAVRQQLSYVALEAKNEKRREVRAEKRIYTDFDMLTPPHNWKSKISRNGWAQRSDIFMVSVREELNRERKKLYGWDETTSSPDAVRIEVDWRRLIDREMTVDDVIAPLQTFYECNPQMRSTVKKLKKQRSSTRPKAMIPGKIALTCAILDCRRAGVRDYRSIIEPYLPVIQEEMPTANRVKGFTERYKQLCALAGFAKPPHNAKVDKTIAGTFGLTNHRLVNPVHPVQRQTVIGGAIP